MVGEATVVMAPRGIERRREIGQRYLLLAYPPL